MGSALEIYRLERYSYPTEEMGLRSLVKTDPDDLDTNQINRSYIKRLPNDPWGNKYQYVIPGEHGEYDLFSFGADGQAGGEGLNMDIGNWDPEN